MNKDINLTKKLMSQMNSKSRVRGRYNSSELYFILHGLTTPEEWINGKERTTEDVLKMWNGIGVHSQIEKLLGSQYSEKKAEAHYKGMTLVGKADFMPPHKPDYVWEFKSSEELMSKAKAWHEHQTKLYCTMFEKPFGTIYQPIQDKNGLYLKHLKTVERDDIWFATQMEKLYDFHLKVEELWKLRDLTKGK